MHKRWQLSAASALCCSVLAGTALAAGGPGTGYTSAITASHLGAGFFSGTVRTATAGKLGKVNGRSIRRRCANHRRVESASHNGDVPVAVNTTPKGHFQFTLPVEPNRQIKIFVLSKRLPDGSFCSFAKTTYRYPPAVAP